jgi:hypothetical protein
MDLKSLVVTLIGDGLQVPLVEAKKKLICHR